mmetsp:Transcript_29755/g.98633  ORF Transcript_29755/g.98633 Transcript_29755/m.98633 type:complete len:217 (-) Transcript_29755:854-1504(-)
MRDGPLHDASPPRRLRGDALLCQMSAGLLRALRISQRSRQGRHECRSLGRVSCRCLVRSQQAAAFVQLHAAEVPAEEQHLVGERRRLLQLGPHDLHVHLEPERRVRWSQRKPEHRSVFSQHWLHCLERCMAVGKVLPQPLHGEASATSRRTNTHYEAAGEIQEVDAAVGDQLRAITVVVGQIEDAITAKLLAEQLCGRVAQASQVLGAEVVIEGDI